MNTWVPARTLADPKVLLLGAALGLLAGSVVTWAALSGNLSSQSRGWKHAKDWAKDSRLNERQRIALKWLDGSLGDPAIELLEVLPSRKGPDSDTYALVGIRFRSKSALGGSAIGYRLICAYDDGVAKDVSPMLSGWGTAADDGVVISGGSQ
jgi:hypothetical protein